MTGPLVRIDGVAGVRGVDCLSTLIVDEFVRLPRKGVDDGDRSRPIGLHYRNGALSPVLAHDECIVRRLGDRAPVREGAGSTGKATRIEAPPIATAKAAEMARVTLDALCMAVSFRRFALRVSLNLLSGQTVLLFWARPPVSPGRQGDICREW